MEVQGDGEWDLIFFFSNSRSKNWKMGALAGNGSYEEMRKFAGGYATPSRAREAVPTELEALTRKAPRLVSYLIIAVHI